MGAAGQQQKTKRVANIGKIFVDLIGLDTPDCGGWSVCHNM